MQRRQRRSALRQRRQRLGWRQRRKRLHLRQQGRNGGNAVDFGLAGEDNFGGNGGNGGIFGGTDSNGAPFRAGGVTAATVSTVARWQWWQRQVGLNLAPALADRVFGGLFGKSGLASNPSSNAA